MGLAIKQLPRDSFYISSKCGEAEGDKFRASLERSLKRLNVDAIDFFHVWCLLFPNQLPERIEKGAIAAAVKAREEGLIKHLVVTTHLSGEDIAKVLDSGYFEGMTIGYNALNFPFRAKGLEAAQKHNIGVVTMNPLGGGLIPRYAERLAFLKGSNDQSVVEAALRFNVSQPAIAAALVGFSDTKQVDQAVAAVENFTPYPPEHIERVKAHITANFEGFCTGCGYCLPCPSDVQIPRLMDAYNQYLLSGNTIDIANRLSWHWSLLNERSYFEQCTECGACEAACTQHLPIIDRIKAVGDAAEQKLMARR
jgi:predicted aldo/keto reductase-like oxidoreductase